MFIHKEMIIYFVMYCLSQRCYISMLIKCFNQSYVCVVYKFYNYYKMNAYNGQELNVCSLRFANKTFTLKLIKGKVY